MSRKPADIDEYVERIKPFLQLDCSLYEACLEADVPYTTVIDYYHKDEIIRKKIDSFKNFAIIAAKQVVVTDIVKGKNVDMAFKFLQARRPKEYANKNIVEHEGEITVNYGKEFEQIIDVFAKPPIPALDVQKLEDGIEPDTGSEDTGEVYQEDVETKTQSTHIR